MTGGWHKHVVLALLVSLLGTTGQAQDIAALERAAQNGDAEAAMTLSQAFHDGGDVVQNFARAAELARIAAEAGLADAQNRLGQYHHEGLGVAQSRDLALQWLGMAAEQGLPQHLFDYASVLEQSGDPQDQRRAADLYDAASAAGLIEASVSLGLLYQNGAGVPQDFERARALYEPAARAGLARAQNNLGLLYVRGSGVEQNYGLAAELFAAAAQQGLATAKTNLGVMYENGFGVPQDDAKAAQLYKEGGNAALDDQKELPPVIYDARLVPVQASNDTLLSLRQAAAQGDPVAEFQLAWLLISAETPTFAMQREAANLFRRAADKGLPAAMANLGLMFMHGLGVPQDYVLGQTWLTLAASQGNAEARTLAIIGQRRMTAGQINEAQERASAAWSPDKKQAIHDAAEE